jgi:hypothetical protein
LYGLNIESSLKAQFFRGQEGPAGYQGVFIPCEFSCQLGFAIRIELGKIWPLLTTKTVIMRKPAVRLAQHFRQRILLIKLMNPDIHLRALLTLIMGCIVVVVLDGVQRAGISGARRGQLGPGSWVCYATLSQPE